MTNISQSVRAALCLWIHATVSIFTAIAKGYPDYAVKDVTEVELR